MIIAIMIITKLYVSADRLQEIRTPRFDESDNRNNTERCCFHRRKRRTR